MTTGGREHGGVFVKVDFFVSPVRNQFSVRTAIRMPLSRWECGKVHVFECDVEGFAAKAATAPGNGAKCRMGLA